MHQLSSPVSKMPPMVVYVILTITGILNVIIVNRSYIMGDVFNKYNIIDLEMAGSLSQAKTILGYWQENGVLEWFYFNFGLDYLFIVSYSLFLFFACHTAALRLNSFSFIIYLGLVVGWLQPLAGILDLVENYALTQVLLGTSDEFWIRLSGWCSIPKFAIALSGMAYCVIALAISTSSGIVSTWRPEE